MNNIIVNNMKLELNVSTIYVKFSANDQSLLV